MPKVKENLIFRAKKLIGSNTSFEVKQLEDSILIFCKLCASKFKVDAIHLKTQYQSHGYA